MNNWMKIPRNLISSLMKEKLRSRWQLQLVEFHDNEK